MLLIEQNSLAEEISSLVSKYGKERSSLMPILQEIQKKYHHISEFAQQEIANQLDIHPVEVYSVISFYSFLSSQPHGKLVVRLCKTITCDLQGKENIVKAIEREFNIRCGETSKDGKLTFEFANCLGMCDQGPAMLINDEIFTKLNAEKAIQIIRNKLRK
jgi:[NiFe] hydrogenase diaphorase moiety large subunit